MARSRPSDRFALSGCRSRPLEQRGNSIELGRAPGLGAAAAFGVGGVGVKNLRELAEAALVEGNGGSGQKGAGGGTGLVAVDADQGLGVGRKGPGPSRTIVVGRLPAGVRRYASYCAIAESAMPASA